MRPRACPPRAPPADRGATATDCPQATSLFSGHRADSSNRQCQVRGDTSSSVLVRLGTETPAVAFSSVDGRSLCCRPCSIPPSRHGQEAQPLCPLPLSLWSAWWSAWWSLTDVCGCPHKYWLTKTLLEQAHVKFHFFRCMELKNKPGFSRR